MSPASMYLRVMQKSVDTFSALKIAIATTISTGRTTELVSEMAAQFKH